MPSRQRKPPTGRRPWLRLIEGRSSDDGVDPGAAPDVHLAGVEAEVLEQFIEQTAEWVKRLDEGSPVRQMIVTYRGLAARLLRTAPESLQELRAIATVEGPVRRRR